MEKRHKLKSHLFINYFKAMNVPQEKKISTIVNRLLMMMNKTRKIISTSNKYIDRHANRAIVCRARVYCKIGSLKTPK